MSYERDIRLISNVSLVISEDLEEFIQYKTISFISSTNRCKDCGKDDNGLLLDVTIDFCESIP